ncbi:MAG: hypothetical protein ACTSUE_20025, partial [Promethearchaeota archaeon]
MTGACRHGLERVVGIFPCFLDPLARFIASFLKVDDMHGKFPKNSRKIPEKFPKISRINGSYKRFYEFHHHCCPVLIEVQEIGVEVEPVAFRDGLVGESKPVGEDHLDHDVYLLP